MTRILHHAAFAAGLLSVAWVGAGYVPGSPLALVLCLLIGAFFVMGALELHRFRQATAGLAAMLVTNDPPAALGPWLAGLHPSLQNAVRLRVEGERVALPGPALTPYLTGLLVLLGMLGTFLGMIVTLRGTGLALESATDVEAIRASLAAPVKGLGLAFGTSVAGVSASAMLGLMSALARRERQRVAQLLDTHIATTLHGHSRAHQREELLRLQRTQTELMTEAMPALVIQLNALVAQMALQGESLQARLLAEQTRFHGEAQRAGAALAESVDRSLKDSLVEGARLAGAAIEPAVNATMAGLVRESAGLREVLATAVTRQLDGTAARLDSAATSLLARWQLALADQQRQSEAVTRGLQTGLDHFAQTFEQRSAALLDGVTEAHAALDTAAARREQERMTTFHQDLATLTTTLQRESQQAGAAIAERQQQICAALEHTAQAIQGQAQTQARATIAEVARLVQAAAEAPRAAAEVMVELRTALSDSLLRDNVVLEERNRLMGTLGKLLDAVDHASTDQRAAVDGLMQTAADMLDRVGGRFAETVEAESRMLQAAAAQVAGGAAEVASLGEGFGLAVQLFSRATEQLMAQLQGVEVALGHSMARSDEQLAYYVAQAREIIDLSLGSQKQILDDLQQLARRPPEPHTA